MSGFSGKRAVLLSAFVCAALAVSVSARAFEKNPRAIFCPIVEKAPVIDGVVGEKEWSGAESITTFVDHVKKVEVQDTRVRVMADSSMLYVAFECTGPDASPENAKKHGRDEASTSDDTVMVMLDMNHDNKSGKVFLVDYLGAQRDGASRYPDIGGLGDVSWNAEWKSAVHRQEESWSVEISIPLEKISGVSIEPGRTVGVNFARSRPGLATRSYLIFKGGGFRPPWFADMVFGRPGVALSEIVMPSWRQGMNTVRLKLRNHGEEKAEVEIKCRALFGWGSEDWEAKRVTIAPDEEASVELRGYAFGDSGTQLELKVYEKEGQEEVYSAVHHFATNDALDEKAKPWRTGTSGSVCFQPEPFVVSLSREEGGLEQELSVITVLRSALTGGEIIRTRESEKASVSADGRLHVATETKGLADGRYAVYITVSGAEGERIVRTAHDFVCVGEEFGRLKGSLESLSGSALLFEKERYTRGLARSSVLLLRYFVEEAEREIAGATVETYRDRLAACVPHLEKAKELADAFAKNIDPLKDKTGLVQRAFVSRYDGRVRPYKMFIPSTYDDSEAMPLIAHLLAEGPAPGKPMLPGVKDLWEHTVAGLEEKGFMAVWPSLTRRLEAELNFFAALEEMKRDYNIDEERIYLMGVSGGGLSSWLIGLRYPDQIAAIAPISGVSVAKDATENPGGDASKIDKARSAYHFPMNALHVPVIVLHGDADPVTRVEVQARPMVKKMRELGLEVEYHEYAGAAHGLGDDYLDAFDKILDFFGRHRNVRYPKTIAFSTPSLRYNKAYWIWLDKLIEEGKFARVKAEVKDNVIRIETENIARFSLVPRPEVLDLEETVTVIIDGDQVMERMVPLKRGHSGPWMRFNRDQEGRWH